MKIVKHIPNTITSMNLLCGTIGVIAATDGRIEIAFLFMLGAALCDFCDGLVARMLNAMSPIGKDLDSLADLVSFGLLPALMYHEELILSGQTGLITCVPLLLVVFSALRLAKFNIDEQQKENFRGLATPAAAMLTASFVYYLHVTEVSLMDSWILSPVFVILSTLVICALMVSRIPMFSMKFHRGAKAESPVNRMRLAFIGVFCVCTVLTALFSLNWSLIILLTFVIYILMNIINLLTTK